MKNKLFILLFFFLLFSIPRVVYAAPANTAFNDDEFYKCVVDTVNHDLDKSYGYDVSIPDTDLSQINELTCIGNHAYLVVDHYTHYDITDTTGLNKMPNLTNIYISGHDLDNIDLSSNTAITKLDVSKNDLTSIDLSHNTSLQTLNVYDNSLSSIDLSHNTELTYVNINFNVNLSSINLGTINKVQYFYLKSWLLPSIDLSHMTALKELSLEVYFSNPIDLSALVNLEKLEIIDEYLPSIDISHNTKLDYLYLWCEKITDVDVSKNTALTHLDILDYKLKNISFENNKELKELALSSTIIENKLKFYNNPKLEKVYINMNNNNTMFDFAHCNNLHFLKLGITDSIPNPKVYLPLGTFLTVYDFVYAPEGDGHVLSLIDHNGDNIYEFNDCDDEIISNDRGSARLNYSTDRHLDVVVGTGAPRDLSDIDLVVEVPNTGLNVSKIYLLVSLVFIISGLLIILKIVLNKEKKLDN